MVQKDWKTVWSENYLGKSAEAKEIEGFLKKNYKDFKYVPWATMVRLMMMQDPESSLEVSLNDKGVPLFSDKHFVYTNNDMQEAEKASKRETGVSGFVHFIRVACVFMGKFFVEIYPVQNNAYNADKIVDQNMVNKAIQRAKAKVISLATGLAFRLYEDGDLQFEDEHEEETKKSLPATTKKVTKVEPKKEPEESEEVEPVDSNILDELVNLISGNENLTSGIQRLNTSLVKKFNFTIDHMKDSRDELISKLSKVNSPETLLKALKNMLK